jgi:chemotaxis protein histidine kinase CheA
MARELDGAEARFVDASPVGRAVLDQITVRRPDLRKMCEAAAQHGGELALLAERLSARSLGELTTALCENAPRWAESLNKLAEVEIEGREALVPERVAKQLSGALTHLVKNAIAHGIELPSERERAGKPAVGLVRIGALSDRNGSLTAVFVDDDGRGIDDNPRLSALATTGASLSEQGFRRSSFRSLPVTDDAELAGRGVGLTAVVTDLEAVGFSLSVERRTPSGARFAMSAREAAQ